MAENSGDLDSFFARKDKKKKGQTGEKKKSKSGGNKNDSDFDINQNSNDAVEHDEWGVIQDDLSKSVMTVETSTEPENNQGSQNQYKTSSEIHTIAEEDMNGDTADKQSGPWKIHQSSPDDPSAAQPPEPVPVEAPPEKPEVYVAPMRAPAAPVSSPLSSGKYVPPSMRNRMAGESAGANLSPYRSPVSTKPTAPPDVQNQCDFPSLGAVTTDTGTANVNKNPWEKTQDVK